MNFNSTKAYDYFVNAKDTHKSWQAIQVLLFGTTLDLLREYIREEGEQPSVLGFLEWQADQECNNFKLVNQLILNYVLAIYVFKVGVRHNDNNLVNSARLKFDDLFNAFKHPIYREVEYRDLKNRVLYDKEAKELRDKNMSFNTTTLMGKSQGGDFVLERKVKRQKLLAPKGSMKAETWRTLSRALENFDEVHVSSKFKLRDPDMQNEIITWRAVVRSSKYLSSPNYSSVPKNIYGEFLYDNLNDFVDVVSKHKKVWDTIEKGKTTITM